MRGRLKKLGAQESFSRKGNLWDNACIESFHAILKKELIYDMEAKSYEDTKETGVFISSRIFKKIFIITKFNQDKSVHNIDFIAGL